MVAKTDFCFLAVYEIIFVIESTDYVSYIYSILLKVRTYDNLDVVCMVDKHLTRDRMHEGSTG